VRSTTVLEIPIAEQEALLRELRQARYGHLLAIHILLLCAAGKNPTEIADFLFCSRSSVYRSVRAYRAGKLDWQRDDPSSPRLSRWQKMLRSLIKLSPRVLGWCRVRWSCAVLAITLTVLDPSRSLARDRSTGVESRRLRLEARQTQRPGRRPGTRPAIGADSSAVRKPPARRDNSVRR
jgi:Homeodomain-like domain